MSVRLRVSRFDWYGVRTVVGSIAVCGVFLAAVVLVCRGIDRHFSETACLGWGKETGREVRFVDVTFWSYPCLVRTTDGRWLDKSQLRDVAP